MILYVFDCDSSKEIPYFKIIKMHMLTQSSLYLIIPFVSILSHPGSNRIPGPKAVISILLDCVTHKKFGFRNGQPARSLCQTSQRAHSYVRDFSMNLGR